MTLLKYVSAALAVVLVSGASVVGYAVWDIASSVKPGVALIGETIGPPPDIGAIESKLKQSAEVQVGLRTLSIKTRRDALSILTAEQRAKEQAEHDKMMQQHKGMGAPHGKNPHGSNPHGANPHGQGTAQ